MQEMQIKSNLYDKTFSNLDTCGIEKWGYYFHTVWEDKIEQDVPSPKGEINKGFSPLKNTLHLTCNSSHAKTSTSNHMVIMRTTIAANCSPFTSHLIAGIS